MENNDKGRGNYENNIQIYYPYNLWNFSFLYLANKFIELNNLTKNFYYSITVLFLLVIGNILIQKFFMDKKENK